MQASRLGQGGRSSLEGKGDLGKQGGLRFQSCKVRVFWWEPWGFMPEDTEGWPPSQGQPPRKAFGCKRHIFQQAPCEQPLPTGHEGGLGPKSPGSEENKHLFTAEPHLGTTKARCLAGVQTRSIPAEA